MSAVLHETGSILTPWNPHPPSTKLHSSSILDGERQVPTSPSPLISWFVAVMTAQKLCAPLQSTRTPNPFSQQRKLISSTCRPTSFLLNGRCLTDPASVAPDKLDA